MIRIKYFLHFYCNTKRHIIDRDGVIILTLQPH